MAKAKTVADLKVELEEAEKSERIERLKARKKQIQEDIKARQGVIKKSHEEQERLRGLVQQLSDVVQSDEFNPVRRTY